MIDLDVYFFFVEIVYFCVLVYCLICCDGEIVQYVFFDKCVWYVGVLNYQGWECCNDFFIGIELEGMDMLVYIDVQYQQLVVVMCMFIVCYLVIVDNMIGYCNIVFDCKMDFGFVFDWLCFCVLVVFLLYKEMI